MQVTVNGLLRTAAIAGMALLLFACGSRVVVPVSTEVTLTIENDRFDKKAVAMPPGKTVTVTMVNRDDMAHAFAVYRGFEDFTPVFEGEEAAPGETREYTFDTPSERARLWFACSIHPAAGGKFILSPREEVMVEVSKD
jgi:plastocyanin